MGVVWQNERVVLQNWVWSGHGLGVPDIDFRKLATMKLLAAMEYHSLTFSVLKAINRNHIIIASCHVAKNIMCRLKMSTKDYDGGVSSRLGFINTLRNREPHEKSFHHSPFSLE